MMEATQGRLRIGTRGSHLARAQTEGIVEQLRALHPELELSIEIIQTTGDARADVAFAEVGTKGMFVKEIEQALLEGVIDVGVHSLKDMPSTLPDGLEIVAIPERADPRDALLAPKERLLVNLSPGAKVGTASLRRQAQLRAVRPDLVFLELRGNLDTRIRKLDEGQYDAIVLACAGLERLGLSDRITEWLSQDVCVPAVGQGALALEARQDDAQTRALLAPLHHTDSADRIAAERAFQAELGGGCSVPAGALAVLEGDTLRIIGSIVATDSSLSLFEAETGPRSEAAHLGKKLAERLLAIGGRELLEGKRIL